MGCSFWPWEGRLFFGWLVGIALIQHIAPSAAASGTPRCQNPPSPYTVSDVTDLEDVLGAWSNSGACKGAILFTEPSAIYELSSEIMWPAGGSLTLNASAASGVVIKAAADSRIISTGEGARLLVIGLELQGGYTIISESGGAVSMGESSYFKAISTTFNYNIAGAGGAVYVQPGCLFRAISSKFIFNEALVGGAIYATRDADIRITDSAFSANTARGTDSINLALGGAVNLGYASGES